VSPRRAVYSPAVSFGGRGKSGDRFLRLGVSAGIALALFAAQRLPIPVELQGIPALAARMEPSVMSALSLGLGPWMTAALLVEIATVLIPRWRPLRLGGRAGRLRLWRATLAVGVTLAAVQSFFIAVWMQKTGAFEPRPGNFAIVIVSFTAGTSLFVGGAAIVSRFHRSLL